jgi:hypothetical protein
MVRADGLVALAIVCVAVARPARADQTLDVPGGTIHVAMDGTPANRDAIDRWIRESASAVAGYFGHFPVPALELRIRTGSGRQVRHGVTFGGRTPTIRISVGDAADSADLRRDWVLVHEMSHLAFPDLTTDDSWAEEGLSTYAEPWARERAGILTADEVWAGLVDGVARAHVGGDRGLHGTEDWGRTYWGGALFWLLADVQIRERSNGRLGLPDALAGILAAGGDIRASWTLGKALAAGDAAIKMTVLADLYREYGEAPGTVDLDQLWRRLGVRARGAHAVEYDDSAPLASVRRAIERVSGSARPGRARR